jgi:hypothetical protein
MFFQVMLKQANSSMSAKDFTNDTPRVNYIRDYLTFLASAIRYVLAQLLPVQRKF